MSKTDLVHWDKVATRTPPDDWLLRSELASYFIRPTDIVCDLGAGAQAIRSMLPSSVQYIPVDCVKQHEDTVVVDFNGEFFLPERPFDVILCLGVLRYLDDLSRFFERLTTTQPQKFIIFTYGFKNQTRLARNRMGSLQEGVDFFSKYIDGLRVVSCISSAAERYMFSGSIRSQEQLCGAPSIRSLEQIVSVNAKPALLFASLLRRVSRLKLK